LRRLDVHRVPLAVVTHAHADHLAGWSGAVRGREVGTVLHGPSGGPGRSVEAGERFRVGAVSVDVLWPPSGARRPDEQDGTAMNDSSVVLRVRSRGVWLLLAGDVEPEAPSAILASGSPLQSEVLKFPHHGSGAQSPDFLRAVGARIATISVGADNDYGHPAPAALRLLRQLRTDWHRTDLEGDIAVALHDGRLRLVTRG
jgi:competence protein ComEC